MVCNRTHSLVFTDRVTAVSGWMNSEMYRATIAPQILTNVEKFIGQHKVQIVNHPIYTAQATKEPLKIKKQDLIK